MASGELPDRDLITLALEAISARSSDRLRPLLADDVRIETGRASHEGIDAALRWAEKSYLHLDRRHLIDDLERSGSSYLVTGRVEYVWRDSGEVGDSSPVYLVVSIHRHRIALLAIHDDEASARERLRAL